MDRINFKSERNRRRFANHYFDKSPVYAGDLIEYSKGSVTELGEVREKSGRYYVGGTDLKSLKGIKRLISMGQN
jgi:hypothetical protein